MEPEIAVEEMENKLEDVEADAEKDEKIEEDKIEKIKSDIVSLKEGIDKMTEVMKDFKDATKPGTSKTVMKFVASTTAASLIFFYITYGLTKLMEESEGDDDDDDDSNSKKAAVIEALTKLNEDIQNLSRLLSVWVTAHEDETITLSGIEVPLVDTLSTYTNEMGDKLESIYTNLMTLSKDDNDLSSFSIPSLILVNTILTDFKDYINILPNLLAYVQEKASDYPTLASFPLEQSDIDTLQSDYDTARKLPY